MKNLKQLAQAEAANFTETTNEQLKTMLQEVVAECRKLSDPLEAWRLTSDKKKFISFLESKEGMLRTELAGRGIICNAFGEETKAARQKLISTNKDN